MKRILLVLLLAIAGGRAHADIIFFSGADLGLPTIDRFSTASGPVTIEDHTVGPVSGMVFDTHGRIIYTATDSLGNGQVIRFNPATNTEEKLATGLVNPTKIALEPGGNSLLISESMSVGPGRIDRLNLQTKMLSLFSNSPSPFGLTYDQSGRLFAILGTNVAQLDTKTGAILQQSPSLIAIKSLTFDPFTGGLYTSDGLNLYRLNPDDLSMVDKVGHVPGFLGQSVVADGKGFIFSADSQFLTMDHLVPPFGGLQFDLSGFQNGPSAEPIELAPLAGLGSNPTPEPSTLVLLGVAGVAGLVVYCWRQRNRLLPRLGPLASCR